MKEIIKKKRPPGTKAGLAAPLLTLEGRKSPAGRALGMEHVHHGTSLKGQHTGHRNNVTKTGCNTEEKENYQQSDCSPVLTNSLAKDQRRALAGYPGQVPFWCVMELPF